ncbi:MAG: hypothetical protein K6U88_12860 [Dehalococcoidia bacterium]|nr:hypothetical protein [Dehalococcoidia bacterium]
MRILAIDVGTGTQDILLFDSSGPIENSPKMVLPSPTAIAASRIRRATAAGRPLLITGTIAGGGPCAWALEDHLRAGLPAFATPDAARTFDDDLDRVRQLGVAIVSDDEAARLDADRVILRDLDLHAIRSALAAFEVPGDFDGIAVACLDHGEAPPGTSDRMFRFDHIARTVRALNDELVARSTRQTAVNRRHANAPRPEGAFTRTDPGELSRASANNQEKYVVNIKKNT